MGISVANILLQVTGESDDAQRELEAVARRLALFGRETAEAEADLDTTPANEALDELKVRLAEFSADDHSAEVNVLIAKAQADIAVLQAELDRIDGENVTVDVDVRRGVVEKIASLTGQTERLGAATEDASSGGISSFVSGIGEAFQGASIFGVSLRAIALAAPLVIAALVAILGQLAAIVASAASAAGAIGALAVAFGAVLVPGILLAIGAVAQFKDEFETAGSAAFALAGNFKDVWNTFQNSTSGGANSIFQGISDALRDIDPLVESLRPAFERLGEAGGDAFRQLGQQFSSPAWRDFFVFAIDSLAKLTPLFASSFGALAKILANIATAAMPFLISGFKALAGALDLIADKTSDIGGLRDVVGGMVDSLGAWGHLLGGLTDLAAAFVEAFAPFGDEIVGALGDGAHNLADWLRSKEGLERIKTFFEETGPLAAELGKLFLNLGLIFIQVGQFFAPLATAVVRGLNMIAEAVSDVLDWMTKVDRALAFKNWGSAVSAIGAAFGSVGKTIADAFSGAVALVKDVGPRIAGAIASGLKSAAGAVVSVASDVIRAVVDDIRSRVDRARAAGQAIFNGVKAGFNAVRGAAVSTARAIIQRVVDGVRERASAAKSAGQAIFNAVRGGSSFNAVRGAVVSVARGIAQAAVAAVRALVGAARGAGTAIFSAVQGGFSAVRGAVVSVARAIGQAAIDAVRSWWALRLVPDKPLARALQAAFGQQLARSRVPHSPFGRPPSRSSRPPCISTLTCPT